MDITKVRTKFKELYGTEGAPVEHSEEPHEDIQDLTARRAG